MFWQRLRNSPWLLMVLVAFAIRAAVIPFLYHEWMVPFVLEHWAFGRIGRSLAMGHGFGSPFADTGPSALLPPVYPYILAAIFKIFGIYTRTSIIAALALNSLFSALTCVPVYRLTQASLGAKAIVCGCGLQLEIEASAETFAQRQTPGLVDAAAKGRMQD